MQVSWDQITDLFGLAIMAALIAGAICPLVGCFLLVRRTSFYGITLPQFAAAGVACGFAVMPWWIAHIGMIGISTLDPHTAMDDSHAAANYHIAWASLFTFGSLLTLVLVGRGKGTEIGRVAASFAVASAATILFAHWSPAGDIFVTELLRGEILAIGRHQFETLVVVMGAVLIMLFIFNRDLLLVSYDREMAIVLGKRVLAIEIVLMLITGFTVSVGAMTVGPMVLFGLLVIPPLAARGVARSMKSFFLLSSAAGVFAALAGVWASFQFDLPLGPSLVAAAAVLLVPGGITAHFRR
jgi:ABC-type Mn2+/Zn2+ transport system permease subunit